MPDGVKRTFFESDRESAIFNPGGGLEGCWNLRGYKDHGEVRNVNITIGMRAFTKYEPIVYKWEDADSIYDPNAFNFLGYPANSVQMDSQFAVDEYAYRASVDLHRVQRMPGAGVILETWLQPDMFPLDMIMVQSKRAGTYGLRYMITSVRHIETNAGGSSQIIARYLPEML
jgi:hypothetical protein